MPPELKTNDLPSHIQHTIIVYLAQVFLDHITAKGEFPTGDYLHAKGFTDPDYLVKKGWVTPPLGRYSKSYRPGMEIKLAMERLLEEKRQEGKAVA